MNNNKDIITFLQNELIRYLGERQIRPLERNKVQSPIVNFILPNMLYGRTILPEDIINLVRYICDSLDTLTNQYLESESRRLPEYLLSKLTFTKSNGSV